MQIGYAFLLVLALTPHCILAKGHEPSEDTEFTIYEVVDAATISGSVRGNDIIVRIASVAPASELSRSLGRDATFSDADVRRFMDNQTISANYLRCLLLSADRVWLTNMVSLPSGETTAYVWVSWRPGDNALKMSAADLLIVDGYAIPEFDLLRVGADEDKRRDESSKVTEYVNTARKYKKGLWADNGPVPVGVRSVPLPDEVNPAHAMPLRSFHVPTNATGKWRRLEATPVVGLTVVCADRADTALIARDAEWIVRRTLDFVKNCDENEILAPDFVRRIEEHMSSQVMSHVSTDAKGHGIKVLVRYFAALEKATFQK